MSRNSPYKYYVYLMSLTAIAPFGFGMPPQASSISGFVTQVDSPDRFQVGSFRISTSPNSKCAAISFQVKHFWYSRLLAPNIFGEDTANTSGTKHIVRSELPCYEIPLTVGTWVKVQGVGSARYFEAHKLTTYNGSIEMARLARGGAIVEEHPVSWEGSVENKGRFWVNGYPADVNSQTVVREAPKGTGLNVEPQGPDSFYLDHSRVNGNELLPGPAEVYPGDCVTYVATRKTDRSLLAKQVFVWPCQNDIKVARFARSRSLAGISPPDYGHRRPGYIQLWRKRDRIAILPEAAIQQYVTRIGLSVLPDFAKREADTSHNAPVFRFIIVQSLGKVMSRQGTFLIGDKHNKFGRVVVPMPDGLIIIPANGGIALLHNEAELASLLSTAVTAVLQRHYMLQVRTIGGINFGTEDIDAFGYWQEAQALRIGIRQMYLAGFDIREAPFAWTVAQGKPVPNPIIGAGDSGSTVPWYSSYAFDYISKYYSDVDYSKLKRGEAEYAQFLEELRKADPEAFEKGK